MVRERSPGQSFSLYSHESCLSATQRASVQTLKLPGMDMHLIHPLDWPSIKQFTGMRHLSLMSVFHVAVGPAMGLVPASQKYLTDPDTGVFKRELSKLFNGELRSLQNLQGYASQLEQTIERIWRETFTGDVSGIETGLGSRLFDILSRSMGSVFWGEQGPFEDREFRDCLRYAASLEISLLGLKSKSLPIHTDSSFKTWRPCAVLFHG